MAKGPVHLEANSEQVISEATESPLPLEQGAEHELDGSALVELYTLKATNMKFREGPSSWCDESVH
ncbi:MAG: hypothetical protein OEO83_04530, partial [Alphaproteobacteria bacterium]|nr:hypothetical protein [Alphaproteobacteria bacterium]